MTMPNRSPHYREAIPLFAAGQGSPEELAAIAAHLNECTVCRHEYDLWRSMPDALAILNVVPSTSIPMHETWGKIAARLSENTPHTRGTIDMSYLSNTPSQPPVPLRKIRAVRPNTWIAVVLVFGVIVLMGGFLAVFRGNTPRSVVDALPTKQATATATPAPGVCNAADFPTQSPGGPPASSFEGPPVGFPYPPLSYYVHQSDAAGTYYYLLCSSGNPTTILAFLKHAIPTGGWTITATTATTLTAVQTSVPQMGLCASVDIIVGSHVGYPGEWNANFHSPTSNCTPSQ